MFEHIETGLKIPKYKQAVSVHLLRGELIDGGVFIDQNPEDVPVYKKIVSLLEDEGTFLPVVLSSGTVEFVNKYNINMLECNCPLPDEENYLLSLMHIENVLATFNDGSSIKGSLMADVPPDKARLSDCLNLPNKFLTLKISESTFILMNKAQLKKMMYSK